MLRYLCTSLFCIAVATPLQADEVTDAVRKGADYLKERFDTPDGYPPQHKVGKASLAGMAMIESGVDTDDPVIRDMVKFVQDKAIEETATYCIALAIMFLDRQGDPTSVPIIQLLGVRLLAGQNENGGWSYNCPGPVNDEESRYLRKQLLKEAQLKTVPDGLKPAPKPEPMPEPKDPNRFSREEPTTKPIAKLDNEVIRHYQRLVQKHGRKQRGGDDNSNTQFGIMGLWVVLKYDVPLKEAFALLDKRFRSTQDPRQGGWNYGFGRGGSTAPMTCAGLLGLAVGHGLRQAILKSDPNALNGGAKEREPIKDEVIDKGLTCLGEYLNGKGRGGKGDPSNYYFLWSLERVGVVFGLQTIGDVDWYQWGAPALVRAQRNDGTWRGSYEPEVDTSFALLFLARANFTRDLSASLKGKFRDPASASLRASGIDLTKQFPGQEKIAPSKPTDPPGEVGPKPMPVPAEATQGSWDEQAQKLADALVTAAPGKQDAWLITLRDTKGSVHTEALARAIPRLKGSSQSRARDALAERLTRMTATTLRRLLDDRNPELRRGAASACGQKQAKEHVPDLIALLGDRDGEIALTARDALKQLTGKDFGPAKFGDPIQVARAIADWQRWWTANQ